MAIKHPACQGYELLDLSMGAFETKTTTTTGIFSLPLELRLKIYSLVLDDEYEIYETGLPALLFTRLQITREFYQLCKLRIVLVHERYTGLFSRRFWRKTPNPLRNCRKGNFKRYRVWQHWERILEFGKAIPRPDLFVSVKIEQWCTQAAVYPEKAIRSHGRCRSCKIRGSDKTDLIEMVCGIAMMLTVLVLMCCPLLLLGLTVAELQREGSWIFQLFEA